MIYELFPLGFPLWLGMVGSSFNDLNCEFFYKDETLHLQSLALGHAVLRVELHFSCKYALVGVLRKSLAFVPKEPLIST